MSLLKIIWNILRALVTAPDTIHWIKKYDSAKKEYQELEQVLDKAIRKIEELEVELETVISKANHKIEELEDDLEALS